MRDENMSYTVKSSERLRKSGSEAETKALLYLMNFRPDSDDIYYFVVDFFNDLTGMDNMASRLWDVQSKGAHHVSPKAIGKELVTLFKNYMSPLTFEAYILFIGSVTGSLRKDSSLTTFGIENVKDAAIEQIKLGLHEEGSAKEYIDSTDLTDENINGFLRKVFFVIDDGKKPSEYVKAIIRQHPNIIPEEKILMVKLFALQFVLRHSFPIVIDSFRAEDLSTGKENTVLEISKSIDKQVILTTTLKHEEIGKYDDLPDVNHINYQSHTPSKILDGAFVESFVALLNDLSIEI